MRWVEKLRYLLILLKIFLLKNLLGQQAILRTAAPFLPALRQLGDLVLNILSRASERYVNDSLTIFVYDSNL